MDLEKPRREHKESNWLYYYQQEILKSSTTNQDISREDCGSDHNPVARTIKVKLEKVRRLEELQS